MHIRRVITAVSLAAGTALAAPAALPAAAPLPAVHIQAPIAGGGVYCHS